jgi:predicted negative regulator of RcsB-dependent stress response
VADDLMTDQQQAEVVRGWIRQNGLWLVAGVVLGLAALVGWNQWQRWQERQAEEASGLFEEVLRLTNEGRLDDATATLDRLTADYKGTVYADQGRMALARLQLDRNDPAAAAAQLEAVVKGNGPTELRHIARLRLARVLIFQEKADEALRVLKDVKGEAFASAAHEVRGDAFLAQGKTVEARSEYEQALAGPGAGINRELVQAKLDDLGGATVAPDAATPAG